MREKAIFYLHDVGLVQALLVFDDSCYWPKPPHWPHPDRRRWWPRFTGGS